MSDSLNVKEITASVDAFLKERANKEVDHGVTVEATPGVPEQGYSWGITVTAQPGTAMYDYIKSQQKPDTL